MEDFETAEQMLRPSPRKTLAIMDYHNKNFRVSRFPTYDIDFELKNKNASVVDDGVPNLHQVSSVYSMTTVRAKQTSREQMGNDHIANAHRMIKNNSPPNVKWIDKAMYETGSAAQVEELFNLAQQLNVADDKLKSTYIFNVANRAGHEKAVSVYEDLKKQGEVSNEIHASGVTAYAKAMNGAKAVETYDYLKQKLKSDVPSRVHASMMGYYFDFGDMRKGFQIFSDLENNKIKIDSRIMNTLIRGHRLAGNPKAAQEVFDSFKTRELEHDANSHVELIMAYAKSGYDVGKMMKKMEQMKNMGYLPPPVVYKSAINAMIAKGEYDNGLMALDMQFRENCLPLDKSQVVKLARHFAKEEKGDKVKAKTEYAIWVARKAGLYTDDLTYLTTVHYDFMDEYYFRHHPEYDYPDVLRKPYQFKVFDEHAVYHVEKDRNPFLRAPSVSPHRTYRAEIPSFSQAFSSVDLGNLQPNQEAPPSARDRLVAYDKRVAEVVRKNQEEEKLNEAKRKGEELVQMMGLQAMVIEQDKQEGEEAGNKEGDKEEKEARKENEGENDEVKMRQQESEGKGIKEGYEEEREVLQKDEAEKDAAKMEQEVLRTEEEKRKELTATIAERNKEFDAEIKREQKENQDLLEKEKEEREHKAEEAMKTVQTEEQREITDKKEAAKDAYENYSDILTKSASSEKATEEEVVKDETKEKQEMEESLTGSERQQQLEDIAKQMEETPEKDNIETKGTDKEGEVKDKEGEEAKVSEGQNEEQTKTASQSEQNGNEPEVAVGRKGGEEGESKVVGEKEGKEDEGDKAVTKEEGKKEEDKDAREAAETKEGEEGEEGKEGKEGEDGEEDSGPAPLKISLASGFETRPDDTVLPESERMPESDRRELVQKARLQALGELVFSRRRLPVMLDAAQLRGLDNNRLRAFTAFCVEAIEEINERMDEFRIGPIQKRLRRVALRQFLNDARALLNTRIREVYRPLDLYDYEYYRESDLIEVGQDGANLASMRRSRGRSKKMDPDAAEEKEEDEEEKEEREKELGREGREKEFGRGPKKAGKNAGKKDAVISNILSALEGKEKSLIQEAERATAAIEEKARKLEEERLKKKAESRKEENNPAQTVPSPMKVIDQLQEVKARKMEKNESIDLGLDANVLANNIEASLRAKQAQEKQEKDEKPGL